jgi:hypothetical protein
VPTPFEGDTSAILERRRKALRRTNMTDNEKQKTAQREIDSPQCVPPDSADRFLLGDQLSWLAAKINQNRHRLWFKVRDIFHLLRL